MAQTQMAETTRIFEQRTAEAKRAAAAGTAQAPVWYACLRAQATDLARRTRESAGDIASAAISRCADEERPIRDAYRALGDDGTRARNARADAHAAMISLVINVRNPQRKPAP